MAARPSLGYSAPPTVPVSIGSTAHNPQLKGATAWSDIAKQMLVWDGLKWTTMSALVPGPARELPPSSFTEVVRTNGRVSSIIVWADATKTLKVQETVITRSSTGVSSTVVKQYDVQGAVVAQATDTVTRSIDGRVVGITTVRA